ncbi:MAG: HAMP domain-containing histidine kinase [Bacteriovorax sp.]|nr:HAMP domain-containing histidine kinase [Bacteriovorax sp.]
MEDQSPARIKEVKKFLSSDPSELISLPLKVKPLRFSKSTFEKKIFNALKNSKKDPGLESKFLFKEELRKLLLSTNEIKELPSAILKLTALNSFESCHVLVHEKGKPVGQNYFYNHSNYEETRLISIQSFNSLFNLVKKSKNKIFNQSLNLKNDLDVVGNFLAKEIDLKNYSVIYLISRNSFLPPSDEEQELFQSLSGHLQPLLMKILDKEKNDLKKEVIKKSLENFPEKIFVKRNSHVLFTNHMNEEPVEKSHLMVFPLDGIENTVMELSNISKDAISTELYHSQRVSLLGELLNTLQHELSNPLFGLNLTGSLLAGDAENLETKEVLLDICLNANRSQTIIKNFSNLYNDQQEYKKIQLYKFIEEVITLTKSETKEIRKIIECVGFEPNDPIELETNSTCLTQIIFNLIINAAQAIKSANERVNKNSIIIKLIQNDKTVTIAVMDDGPGVKSEFAGNIFEPFFTTKDSGTGLGLSICQNLARQLGSKIQFQNNSPFAGATFSINLPLI